MAVAVKNATEAPPIRAFDRLPVASIAGTLYVVVGLAAVFVGLPRLWEASVTPWLAPALNSFVDQALLGVAMLAAVVALMVLGVRLAGPNPVKGLRAGVFTGFVGFLLIGFLAEGVGFLLESMFYSSWPGGSGVLVGKIVTALLGIALLVLAGRGLFQSSTQRWLVAAEEQGWFSTWTYKRSQGQRVRRGTMLAVLVLGGCGVYTLVAHGTLNTASPNWEAPVPFTGIMTVTLQTVGDNANVLKQVTSEPGETLRISRFELRDLNAQFAVGHMKVESPGDADNLSENQVLTQSEFDEAKKAVRNKTQPNEKPLAQPTEKPVVPATGTLNYAVVPLLPEIRFTLPLLLAAFTLWLGWRIVNLPSFSDFLIATEAELNKVSWTTRPRLIQDTVVVLVTVVLLAFFLLFADIIWSKLLQGVGVIQVSRDKSPQGEVNREIDW